MIRIAVAGAGGLAWFIARELSNEGTNAVLVLSRSSQPDFEELCQVQIVDYDNQENLQYALRGIDLVISTVSGAEQLNLIDAARLMRVRRFVPSEFEGCLSHRPSSSADDALDRGSHSALDLLRRWESSRHHPMRFTVFSCGVFYERFAPEGLAGYNIGSVRGGQNPGDYLVNLGQATAEMCETDSSGRPAQISMTSAYDTARFVAAAVNLDIGTWPVEFKLRGDNMTARDIYALCTQVTQTPFELTTHNYIDLQTHIDYYYTTEQWDRYWYFQQLLATANGRYHIRRPNLNSLVSVEPQRFQAWLQDIYAS